MAKLNNQWALKGSIVEVPAGMHLSKFQFFEDSHLEKGRGIEIKSLLSWLSYCTGNIMIAEPSVPVPEALGERTVDDAMRAKGSTLGYLRNNPSDGLGINLHRNGQQISIVVSLGQDMAGCFTLISILLFTNEI